MTKVTFYRHGPEVRGFEVDGHAESSTVCSGISAMCAMTLVGLEEELNTGATVVEDEAKWFVYLLPDVLDTHQAHGSQILLHTFLRSMVQLNVDYPGNMEILYQEV